MHIYVHDCSVIDSLIIFAEFIYSKEVLGLA